MHELMRTNNIVLISAVEALLKGAGIPHVVLDQHMSIMEGSLGLLPRRIMVDADDGDSARRLLVDAGLAHELRLEGGSAAAPPAPEPEAADTSDDAVLNGRLRLFQKRRGHRVGHDAILLAAAMPAHPGDRVIELGAGVGAAGLALALRVPDVAVTLVEREPDLTDLAQRNAVRNGLPERVSAVTLDIEDGPEAFARHGLLAGQADGVLMNPPFNDPSRQNVSPDADRRAAHVAAEGGLESWVAAAAWLLHDEGVLNLIWRADGLAEVLALVSSRFGTICVLPVHGKAGQPAIRVIVRARKGGRGPLALLPGLDLNDGDGRPTEEAEAVLRHLQPLPE